MIICKNCGTENDETAKFCIKCGKSLVSVSETQVTEDTTNAQPQEESTVNKNLEASKDFSMNYWNFFRDSIKHPFIQTDDYNSNFGWVSLILNSIFTAFIIQSFQRSATTGMTSFVDNLAGTSTTSELGFKTYFTALILAFALTFITYAVAFFGRSVLLGDKSLGFTAGMTRFAHMSNFALILSAVGGIFGLIGAGTTTIVVLALIGAVLTYQIVFFSYITQAAPSAKFDKFYAILSSQIVLFIVYFIIITILASVLKDSMIQLIDGLF